MTVRTRFAPSPTGYLHIGGARTALFCWLYARHMNGQFILRIEDTDLERSTPEHVQAIIDGMQWLKLDHDEGPFYQTKRFDRYKEVINQLLAEGKAYRCYCSRERLDTLRETQLANKQKPCYDGRCRCLTEVQEGPFVIRFKNPTTGSVLFDDAVNGVIEFQNSELDDLIIARSDGAPTYNFAVVVDDYDMKITHVVRGTDHINNTPRQINIFKALGVEPPRYAHVPMILGADGKKLSKRHGADNVMQFREQGYLPQALLNYIVRLGWSHGDQEIFSIEEMIQFFDLQNINNSPAIFDFDKLLWLNQHYLKTLDPADIIEELTWHMNQQQIDIQNGPALTDIIIAQRERCKTLKEMAERSRYFYEEIKTYDEAAMKKHFSAETAELLHQLLDALTALSDWSAAAIHQVIIAISERLNVKLGQVAQPIRIAMTGSTISPPIDITLQLIGKDRSINRLMKAINYTKAL